MRSKLSENSKRLIYTDCFKFTYLGRVACYIKPLGDEYKVCLVGAHYEYHGDLKDNYGNRIKDLVFIRKPSYKEFYKTKSIYSACILFSHLVELCISCFNCTDFNLDLDNILENNQEFLREIKEQM